MLSKNFTYALFGACAIALTNPAIAETITKRTTTTTINPGSSVIDFSLLDHNRDGVISRREIGDQLFSIYDADHNDYLDNTEYRNIRTVTIRQPEQRFVRSIDLDDDGYADVTEYTYDNVANRTRLYHYQRETNGLSADQLLESPFDDIDVDDNASIARDEWYNAYMAQIAPLIDAGPYPSNNGGFNE